MQRLDDLCVVCWPGAAKLGEALPAALIDHLECRDHRLTTLTPRQLLDADLRRGPMVVWLIVGDRHEDDLFFEALDHLAVAQVPTMLTRAGEELASGVTYNGTTVIVPPDLDAHAIALTWRCLHSQSETIRNLQRELSITRRHHGGLRGQMDKLDEELRLAARVQQEFLPTALPQVGDVQVEVMFRPATYVSGDVYDVQRLDEDHIGLWIADVVGHGVPAALLTMFVKAALPTKEIGPDGYRIVPPDEALARLNDEMVSRATGQARFATACYAVLNCRNHRVQVARAGHPHPLILRDSGEVEYLEPDGPLLGVFADEQFDLMTYQMHRGDRFMIHSDGFETCFADGEQHDTTRYRQEFAKLGRCGPTQAIEKLCRVVDDQPGSLHQVDDLTVVMAGVGMEQPSNGHRAAEAGLFR